MREIAGRQVHRPQVFRHVGPEMSLEVVHVRRHARDQDIRLPLRVHQMPQVSWMDNVEHTVTHDHSFLARSRSDNRRHLFDRLDLV